MDSDVSLDFYYVSVQVQVGVCYFLSVNVRLSLQVYTNVALAHTQAQMSWRFPTARGVCLVHRILYILRNMVGMEP